MHDIMYFQFFGWSDFFLFGFLLESLESFFIFLDNTVSCTLIDDRVLDIVCCLLLFFFFFKAKQ